MDGPKGGWDMEERRNSKPRKRSMLIAIATVILVAALITVVIVVIHQNNQEKDNIPAQIGTIPPPIIWSPPVYPSPYVSPPTISPPTISPPTISPPTISPPTISPSVPPPTVSPSVPPPVTSPVVSATIVMACDTALYRNVCISTLSSYPGASHANLTQLAGIAVELCLDEAKKAYEFVGNLRAQSVNKSDQNALKDCVDLLKDTGDQLNSSLSTLTHLSSGSFQSEIGDIQTWVSAALTNPATCIDGLQEVNANMVPVIKAKTENVTEYMSNALAVINKLSET
uniref:Pectin methylesterase inhibitor 2 n=1 Tax=Cunninghamia lanceolata TaxID=28977 RepID=A0A6G9W2S2_CUNLA|nr:pectin methylesterase inhibitor 2 [Cunninghamia lanceolata]